MTVGNGLVLLAGILALGAFLSRREQSGYIDFLTPMLVLYFLHYVTRGLFLSYLPGWVSFNPLVVIAGEDEIAEALFLTSASVAVLIVSYLGMTRLFRSVESGASDIAPLPKGAAATLLWVGAAFRSVSRLARSEVISLPDWALPLLDTFGWAALAGIFLAAFNWARSGDESERKQAGYLAIFGTLAILLIDGRFATSREATLQPILALLLGRAMGQGATIRRIVAITAIVGIPLFLWIGAMKTYQVYEPESGPGYLESVTAVQERFGLDWGEFVVGSLQARFHGLDSLVVIRAKVPSIRPYEEGSVWSQVLLSAFVPRFLYPEKDIGWGTRFALEFWGMRPEAEGQASIGISQLGNFYVYDGIAGCLVGMAILGGGLGLLAAYLRRRGDVLGLLMFFLVALTVLQVDRDLERALGGVLKVLTIFWIVMYLHGSEGDRVMRACTPTETLALPVTANEVGQSAKVG